MENTMKSLQLTSHTDLRRIAEARFGTRTPKLRLPHNNEALKRIFHELVVHQIELVMQNKELVALIYATFLIQTLVSGISTGQDDRLTVTGIPLWIISYLLVLYAVLSTPKPIPAAQPE